MGLLLIVAVAITVIFLLRRRPARGGSAIPAGLRRPRTIGLLLLGAFVLFIVVRGDSDGRRTLHLEPERLPCPAFHEEDCPLAPSPFGPPRTTTATPEPEERIPREPCPAYYEEDCPPATTIPPDP